MNRYCFTVAVDGRSVTYAQVVIIADVYNVTALARALTWTTAFVRA
jgi:hypothetical protein